MIDSIDIKSSVVWSDSILNNKTINLVKISLEFRVYSLIFDHILRDFKRLTLNLNLIL